MEKHFLENVNFPVIIPLTTSALYKITKTKIFFSQIRKIAIENKYIPRLLIITIYKSFCVTKRTGYSSTIWIKYL